MSRGFALRKWHIWTALGIGVLSAGDALYLWNSEKGLAEALHGAAEVALLLLILELLVILLLEQDDYLSYARGLLEGNASPMAAFEKFAENDGTLLGRLGREAVKVLLRTYKLSLGKCVVVGQEEAIKSYLIFWQYLVERQKKEKYGIKVQVVHSLDIAIWNEEKMQMAIDLQAEFVNLGGEIVRIFISPEAPSGAYLKIIEDMKAKDIRVLYARKAEFARDFLVAPSLSLAVNWTGTMARKIREIEYLVNLTDEEMMAFVEMWRAANVGAVE